MNWAIQYTSDSKYALIYSGKEKICEIDIDQNQDGVSHAKLIAAAPDLLEICQLINASEPLPKNLQDHLEYAIKKATE